MLRQEHKAGEKLFVDWAGTTIPIYNPRGGAVQQAHLFVAVLGASSYTYAEATIDEQLASWIGAHVRATLVPPCMRGLHIRVSGASSVAALADRIAKLRSPIYKVD